MQESQPKKGKKGKKIVIKFINMYHEIRIK